MAKTEPSGSVPGNGLGQPPLGCLVRPAFICTGLLTLVLTCPAGAQQTRGAPAAGASEFVATGARGDAEQQQSLVPGGWRYSTVARTDLIFTDNAYLTTANRTSGFVFTPAATFTAQRNGRTTVDASITAAYDIYAQSTDLSGFRVKALIDGTTRFDDAFSLRARAATDLQPSSYLGVMPATERAIGGNQVQVLTYGLSPRFAQPISNNVIAEANYDFSGVTFVRPPSGGTNTAASDNFLHRARASLFNRPRSTALNWNFTGSYEYRDPVGGGPAAQRAGGEAGGQYHVSSHFALLGRGGYDWIDEPTITTDLSGAYGLAGFEYRPTSRSSLRAEAGYRYGKPNYLATLKYSPGQRLHVSASYSQGIESSQGFLNDLFQRAGRDEFGNLVDPDTGLPPDPRTSQFDLSNQAYRYSRVRLGLNGTFGRTFYNTYGNYERRGANGLTGESWGGQIVLGRTLSRQLTATVEGRYAKSLRDFATVARGDTETTAVTGRLTYQMNRTLAGSVRYVHLRQSTSLVRTRENVAVISLSKTF